MQLKNAIFVMALIFLGFSIKAQKNYLDSSVNSSKIKTENRVIDHTSDKVNSGIDKIFDGSIFKKKNKNAKKETAATTESTSTNSAGITVINITNTDFTSLSKISDAIKTNQQVTAVERTFSNNTGAIKVTHSCTQDQLFDDLVAKAGDKFDVVDIKDDVIDLKMK